MSLLRNQKFQAILLVVSAVLGLIAANSPVAPAIQTAKEFRFEIAALNLHLDVVSVIEELLLPIFFFVVGLELKHELLHGQLKNRIRIVTPALAAIFGVAVPASVYAVICWGDSAALAGWAIPTATDITFALAVFVIFGSTMPAASRTFLVAFATIDDVIAIVLIALLFGSGLNLAAALAAVLALGSFWLIQSRTRLHGLSLVLGLVAWYFTLESGIHPTVAGVALGLLVRSDFIHAYELRLQPWVGALILPLFAFVATGIKVSGAAAAFSSVVFLAVLLRPFGKILGITAGALIGQKLIGTNRDATMNWRDYLAVSTLGGIGFTVSILVISLALAGNQTEGDAALLATLLSALISVALGALALGHRRLFGGAKGSQA